jgi:hypothetical protein
VRRRSKYPRASRKQQRQLVVEVGQRAAAQLDRRPFGGKRSAGKRDTTSGSMQTGRVEPFISQLIKPFRRSRDGAPPRGVSSSRLVWSLSSDAKCNTPRRLDIGKVVQDP